MPSAVARAVDLAALAKDAFQLRRRPGDPALQTRLVDRLASLRGIPRKIGQIVALTEIDLTESAYRPLTEGDGYLSLAEVRAILETEYGRPLDTVFARLDPAGIGASIGQVHRATLPDGQQVAVKIKYPDIEAVLGVDLKSLSWLTFPFGGMSRFDLEAYRAEVGTMLRRELDYRFEADALARVGPLAATVAGLDVPRPIPGLSTSNVLVTTWLDGTGVESTRSWPLADRVTAGRALVGAFVHGLIDWRMLHADPHPGNIRYHRDAGGPRVGLIDFGCVRSIEPETAAAFGGLVRFALDDDWGRPADSYLDAFSSLGFRRDLLTPLADRLAPVARALCRPLVSREPVDLTQVDLGAELAAILGEQRMNFRAAGPASLLFVIRAWHGLLAHLRALEAPFPWRDLVEPLIGPSQATAVPAPPAEVQSPARSRWLKIRVTVGGCAKVELTFPATRAEALVELVPPELHQRIEATGVDVAEIAARAVNSQFRPGVLLRLEEADRTVEVWLE